VLALDSLGVRARAADPFDRRIDLLVIHRYLSDLYGAGGSQLVPQPRAPACSRKNASTPGLTTMPGLIVFAVTRPASRVLASEPVRLTIAALPA
jgi:hypothetical protein